jgi:hypothetical protein
VDQPNVRSVKLNTPPAAPLTPHLRAGHPRLLLNSFDELKRKIDSDAVPKRWYARVKQRADELLHEPVRPFGTNPSNFQILEHSREMENRTFILSLAYQIERERPYLDRLWLEIENTASYPTWKPSSFLSVAEMLLAYGIAYDWNYLDWTPEQRRFILDTMLDKGLTYGFDAYNGIVSGTHFVNATHNWNLVCNVGLMMAAIAIADESPDLAEFVLERAANSIKNGLKAYAPQGAYPEGAMYWAYGTNFLTYGMAALDSAFKEGFELPDKFKFYEAPGVAETPDFPIYMSGFAGAFNYGDSSPVKPNSPLMLWFAAKFGKPQYAWYFLHMREQADKEPLPATRTDVFSILWYDSRYRELSASFPLDRAYMQDTGPNLVLMRSSWHDPDGIYVGLKGGYNLESHSALSNGTFVLDALGERWATMRGPGSYQWPGYFDRTRGRYLYYNNRAEGQNTLVMNPDSGPDQALEATGRVIRFQANAWEAFGILDMTEAYAPHATSVKRGIRLFDGRSRVLIQDEVTALADTDVWWFMHTPAQIRLSGDRRSAMLAIGDKRLVARILEGPAGAGFLIMDAKPLPLSPHPPEQPSDYGKKLAIRMQHSRSIRLAIEFVPLRPGESPPRQHPAVTDMSEWMLEDSGYPLPGSEGYVHEPSIWYEEDDLPDIADLDISVEGETKQERVQTWIPVVSVRANAGYDNVNTPDKTIDHDLNTRWSADSSGEVKWICYDLGAKTNVHSLAVAGYLGDQRSYNFDVDLSDDGETWRSYKTGLRTSGTTLYPEMFPMDNVSTSYIRFRCFGHGDARTGWNGFTEVRFYESETQAEHDRSKWDEYFNRKRVYAQGDVLRLVVKGLSSDGQEIELDGSKIVFASSDPAVAQVDPHGTVTITGSGEARITVMAQCSAFIKFGHIFIYSQ